MNRKLTFPAVKCVLHVVLLSTVALLLISSISKFEAYAPGTAVAVEPPKYFFDLSNGTIGTLFNVTVRVSNMDDMKTWQVVMYFNDSVINVTRWYEPTWDSDYVFHGKTTIPAPYPPDVRYEHVELGVGWVGVGSSLFPSPSPGEGFTGDGLLCIITFNITAIPPEGGNYTSPLDIQDDPKYTYWMKVGETVKRAYDTYTDGEYEIIPEFYSLIMLLILMIATISVVLGKKVIGKSKFHMKQ